jgi:photosystem II stability/assembly factor-like uncharacterized protein
MRKILFASCILALAPACKKKSGDGTGGGGGAWLVGASGLMANLLPDGQLGDGYDLGVDDDLLAIACRGLDTAFVVGESGTLLRTYDGGDSWAALDAGTTATLRDVAAAHGEAVYVAGDGVLLASDDSGDHWIDLEAARGVDWRSIATAEHGERALAVAADGRVVRVDGAQLFDATLVPGARAIGLSHDGSTAAVVGDGGALVVSQDGGITWAVVATGVSADLHAVWPTDDGAVIAVGDGGTVVRAIGDDVEVSTPGLGALRAVHINGAGEGLAAGDRGEVLRTDDGGYSWSVVDIELGGTVFGLDEIDGEGHL